jgi:uncharacterized protein (TIGR02271 family)
MDNTQPTEREPIPVISKDGVRGTLVEGLPAAADTSHLFVRFENGQQALVPAEALTEQADGRYYYLAMRVDELMQQGDQALQAADRPYVLPVIAEVLDIQRQRSEVGRVRVHKRVNQQHELVDEPLLREEVQVERVAINQVIDQPVSVREEGDTLIVPIMEEVLVVEKRLLLKEEVRITKRTVETRQPQEITLRSEEVIVERVEPQQQSIRGKNPAS